MGFGRCEDKKIREVIRLLGGAEDEEFAIKHAEELLKNAKEYKNNIL